ncbi:MAG: alpha/beta fold hydrolase, partial [Pseudonocardiaceae bacterium]
PWTHRDVSANGISLHVADTGDGPLVVLLHGFAECWWVWRHQLTDLAESGYRVAAVDLRGYGDSDKPPRGYDAWTLAGDVAGLVRSLGARRAHLVGHAWGGFLAWTAAILHPRVVSSVSVLGAAHPLSFRASIRRGWYQPAHRPQLRAAAHAFRFQLPVAPERALVADHAAAVEQFLRAWSGPAWQRDADFTEVTRRLRSAMLIPGVAHSALEYYRWAFRSQFRGDGSRFATAVNAPSPVPVLQLHGDEDRCILPSTARESVRWTGPGSRLRILPGIGHYPHLEDPEQTTRSLQEFLKRC